jgi:carboxypeptidase C (cathepsin A)
MMGRLLALLLLLAPPALAQPQPPPAPAASASGPDRTTTHSLTLPGRTLEFQAQVATIRLANPQGAAQAEIVTTAFTLPDADPARRPVTFAINGGPGASSAWLNLGAIGPWRVPFTNPSHALAPVDNAETWLDFTDLVFIDPPGTGFSRITAQGDDVRRQFYSVDGDIDALGIVIRRWLEANHRLLSPKFIVGESYGGFRGPKLARNLLERQGIAISGLVLISPVLDFNGRDTAWNPLREVVLLPSMAAAARRAHGRAELGDVEAYATGEFLQDLLRGEGDQAAVDRLTTHVAALTGLDPSLVRRRLGRVDVGTFLRDREPGRVDSPYDATLSAPDPFPAAANDNSPDPLLDGMRGPLTSAMLAIYATRLNWQPEGAPNRQYEVLNNSVAGQWDYGRRLSRPESYSELRQYLALDPAVRVAVAHGVSDLVTPYFANKLLLDQTPAFGDPGRLVLWTYGGGHMFYSRDESRAKLHDDAAALVAAALAAR